MSSCVLSVLFLTLAELPQTTPSAAPRFAIPRETYVYKQVGDCPIRLDVHRLPGADMRPVILWIHGGALIAGDRDMLRSEALREQLRRYLAKGYVVVSIDYRLAPETKLPAILEDLRDSQRWIREHAKSELQVDPDRMAVVGHSAGGYLALASGYLFDPPPRAIVSFYGYGDIAGDWYAKPDPHYRQQPMVSRETAFSVVGSSVISNGAGQSGRGQFYLYCRQNGLWPKEVVGVDPAADPRGFDRYCPVRNVTARYPPTILLHGDKDTDVPHDQSVQMASEFDRKKIDHELLTLEERGHGFDSRILTDEAASDAFDEALRFLESHTRPGSAQSR
jgi:acetyl esterase/lipase